MVGNEDGTWLWYEALQRVLGRFIRDLRGRWLTSEDRFLLCEVVEVRCKMGRWNFVLVALVDQVEVFQCLDRKGLGR